MAYEKLTFDTFKENLKNGKYEAATGARRAVGKSSFSGTEKEQAAKIIDKHFNVAAAPKAEKKPKGVIKRGPKKAAHNGTSEHVSSEIKALAEQSALPTEHATKTRAKKPAYSDEEGALIRQVHLAGEIIGTVTQAVETMRRAKEACPGAVSDADQLTTMTSAGQVISGVMQTMHGSLKDRFNLPDVNGQLVEESIQGVYAEPAGPLYPVNLS